MDGSVEGSSPGSCRADGACLLVTPPSGQSAQNPCYSPDAKRLLFTLFHGGYNVGPAALLIVPSLGGASSTLVDDQSTNVNLPSTSWNAATNRIVYTSDKLGPEEIMTAAPDGSGMVRVTTHTGANYFEPSFSPDGRQIVFEVNRSSTSAEIWRVAADGGTPPTQLTSGHYDRQPNVSPAGDKILFQRMGATWAIYTMGIDGSGVTLVTPSTDSSTDASWSPDGARIVYSAARGGAGASLYVMPIAGGGEPRRITTAAGYDGAPSWSPDGAWVAFESSMSPNGDAPTALWRVAAPR